MFRYAFRTLAKNPTWTLAAVACLAIGIGANTTVYTAMRAIVIAPVPTPNSDRLVMMAEVSPRNPDDPDFDRIAPANLVDWMRQTRTLEHIAGFAWWDVNITGIEEPERVTGFRVTPEFFRTLGERPMLGRVFTDDEGRDGHTDRVILGHPLWKRRFGGDAAVVGRTVQLNGAPHTIVGVMGEDFIFPPGAELWKPFALDGATAADRDGRRMSAIARLRPTATLEQARAEATVIARRLEIQYPDMNAKWGMRVEPAQVWYARHSRPYMIVMLASVAFVLLIGCANVANLLLARGAARQKEVAIRLALGASRGAIVRQRLIESLVLAGAGAVLGLAFAWWTGALLLKMLPFDSGAQTLSASPDIRAIAFAFAGALLTALLFGLAPALQSTRPALVSTLKDESGSVVGGTGHARFRKGLVVAQVGLSVLLLAGAGLFARSLYNLKTLNPGFQADQLLGFSLNPSLNGYSRERSIALFQQLEAQLALLPDVRSASASVIPLMTNSNWSSTVKVEGYKSKEGEDMNPSVNGVGPGFFATMGQPLVSGREFSVEDVTGAPRVAIINETMAKYFFGTDNPLGRHIGWGRDKTPEIEIVGVVKDSKTTTLRQQAQRFVYVPYMQETEIGQMTFYVRARGEAGGVGASVRQAAQRVDPNLPIFDMKTMTAVMDESLFIERMVAALSVAFGALATLLAAIGLYGVMSYTVARRTREIGIRMALGAERNSVMWLVLKEVALMVGIGVGVGLPLAVALSRIVQSQLFDLSAHDPIALVAAAVILASVAVAAGYLPARRATRVDPMLALRYE
jgi:predicted permease